MGLFDVNSQENLIDLNGFKMQDPLKLILVSYDSERTYIDFDGRQMQVSRTVRGPAKKYVMDAIQSQKRDKNE